jgi:hypothetical protein
VIPSTPSKGSVTEVNEVIEVNVLLFGKKFESFNPPILESSNPPILEFSNP